MTAKNKILIENNLLHAEAKDLRDAGFIGDEDFRMIKANLPVGKTSRNILVRIGFFVLGCFLYSSIMGATSIFFLDSTELYKIMLLIYALIGLGVAEFLCKNDFHNYGLDDAFILGFQLVFFASIAVITESPAVVLFSMAIIGAVSCYRYFSTLSMLYCLLGTAGFVGYAVTEGGIIPRIYLPFIMLLLAVGLYFAGRKLDSIDEFSLYQNSINLILFFSLILGYLSMNYLVVREMSEDLMNIVVEPGSDIPLAFIFYFFTFAIPIFFIYVSLKKREKSFLYIGLAALAFSIYTIRHYYSVMPIETALIIGGILIFAIAYLFMRRIRENETGITFKPDRFTESESLAYAQALIVNSNAQVKARETSSPMPFGGGGYSGGGAGGQY